MFKSKQQALHISIFLAIVMLVSACSANLIKPIRKDIIGNSFVRNITVEAIEAAATGNISNKVKKAVRARAKSELSGKIPVDIKININHWQGTDKVIGGGITKTLFGSKTELHGIANYIDTKTGAIIGKFRVNAVYEEGGFLSAKKTISFINTEQQVLDSFARQAIYFLE